MLPLARHTKEDITMSMIVRKVIVYFDYTFHPFGTIRHEGFRC